MDFRERGVSFQEADRRYAELTRQREAGTVSDEEFDARCQQLMVQDDVGRPWAKFGESGEWRYHDGNTWVRGTPPAYREGMVEPASSPTQNPSDPGGVEHGRRRVPPRILVAGLGGIALVGTVLILWVLLPYLRGEPAPSEQGGGMMGEQGEAAPDEAAAGPGGAALDAVFIHRATPENISANSTYLDYPPINGDPDVVLYVTQNWNPGGGGGTYNNHPIGVWYDSSRQRWAIFNQDRKPMPDRAAFNVAVLEEPTEAR